MITYIFEVIMATDYIFIMRVDARSLDAARAIANSAHPNAILVLVS